jgi:hypothetical protein
MKITVLTYLDSEDENSKDYEAVVPQVARALRGLGHRVSILGVHGDGGVTCPSGDDSRGVRWWLWES